MLRRDCCFGSLAPSGRPTRFPAATAAPKKGLGPFIFMRGLSHIKQALTSSRKRQQQQIARQSHKHIRVLDEGPLFSEAPISLNQILVAGMLDFRPPAPDVFFFLSGLRLKGLRVQGLRFRA